MMLINVCVLLEAKQASPSIREAVQVLNSGWKVMSHTRHGVESGS